MFTRKRCANCGQARKDLRPFRFTSGETVLLCPSRDAARCNKRRRRAFWAK